MYCECFDLGHARNKVFIKAFACVFYSDVGKVKAKQINLRKKSDKWQTRKATLPILVVC